MNNFSAFLRLLSLSSIIFFTSCNTNDDSIQSIDDVVLSFSTIKELENKANSIHAKMSKKEDVIIEKITSKSDISSLSKNKKIESFKLKYEDVKEDLEFYHENRIKAIHEIRDELSFTSIQSIVDELNSLKSLNPQKAEELFEKNKHFIDVNEFQYFSKFNKTISSVTNTKGNIIIKDKIINLHDTTNEISLLKSYQSQCIGNQEDILLTNGIFAITWHAGVRPDNAGLFGTLKTDELYAQFGAYILTPYGYAPYISTFNTSGSTAHFVRPSNGYRTQVSFRSNVAEFRHTVAGTYHIASSNNYCLRSGVIGYSIFQTIIGNQIVTATNTTDVNF